VSTLHHDAESEILSRWDGGFKANS